MTTTSNLPSSGVETCSLIDMLPLLSLNSRILRSGGSATIPRARQFLAHDSASPLRTTARDLRGRTRLGHRHPRPGFDAGQISEKRDEGIGLLTEQVGIGLL